jgi:hypothetical protein
MSIIYSYPIKGAAVDDDLILISDSASTPKFATKQVRVSGLPFSNNQGTVTSVGVSMPSAFAVAGSPITSSGTIAVTTTGGNVGQFLAHDGTWGTPAGGAANPAGSTSEIQYNNGGAFGASPDFSYASSILRVKHTINVLGQGNGNPAGRIKLHCENSSHGVTLEGPAHAGNNSYLLKLPSAAPTDNQILEYTTAGSLGWIATPSGGGGGSYTAGDGLQLNGTVFSTDLKLNGGLAIETTSLALDLSASSIQGTLATSDGGTGSSNTEYCDLTANVTGILPVGKGGTGVNTLGASRLILGNGTSAVTSISSQTKGTMVVGNNTTTTTLAVGTDGHVLTAASSEATGVRWTAPTVAASNVTGTLPVANGGTGSSTTPAAVGSISFANSGQTGYDTSSQFKYDQNTLTNYTTSTTTPAVYLVSANATSVGGVGGTYTGGIGAVNIQNTSTVNNSVPLVISSSHAQGGAANISRLVTFYGGSSGAAGSFRCGDIFTNSSVPDVSLTNASDYRLKENVVPLSSSTIKIKALNPVSYNMIGYSQVAEGFLAHELQEHFPNAVVGEKDAVDSDGNINPQMVDYTKIIPALVGTIKELTARIEALEA